MTTHEELGLAPCAECGNYEVVGQPCSWCRVLASNRAFKAEITLLEASLAFERTTIAHQKLDIHQLTQALANAGIATADLRVRLAEVERERDGANLAVAHAQKFAEWAQKERDALRAELAAASETISALTERAKRAERERDDLSAKLDAMTNQAVMLSGRRATIVDVSERSEIASLRVELAEVRQQRADAIGWMRSADNRARVAEAERDAAIRERDERPAISRVEADAFVLSLMDCGWAGDDGYDRDQNADRAYCALRAHAASATPEPPQGDAGRCDFCNGSGTYPSVTAPTCHACNDTGRKGERC